MERYQTFARQLDTGVTAPLPAVTVFYAGTSDLAPLYADNLETPSVLANPFVGDSSGLIEFYAKAGRYDVLIEDVDTPYTIGDVLLSEGIRMQGIAADGVTDDYPAIQALIDAMATNGGVIELPTGVIMISEPLRLRDGIVLRGQGRRATIITCLTDDGGFNGDSMIRAFNRDDNNVNVYEKVTVEDLRLQLVGQPSVPFHCIDLVGFRNSTFARLDVYGNGLTGGLDEVAFNFADQTSDGFSNKTCFFNSVVDIDCAGPGWGCFARFSQRVGGDLAAIRVRSFNSYSRYGIWIDSLPDSADTTMTDGYMLGDNDPAGVALYDPLTGNVLPPNMYVFNVVQENFVTPGQLFGADSVWNGPIVVPYGQGAIHLGIIAVGQSGTDADNPIEPDEATPVGFVGGLYVRLPAGTSLIAGLNNYNFGLSSALQAQPDGLIVIPRSGIPQTQLTYQARSDPGDVNNMILTVCAAAPIVLAEPIVLRIVNIAPSILI